MKKLSLILLGTFALLFVNLPATFAQLEEEVTVDVMEVWVKVTDKDNRLVTDLKPEEFQILIDNQPMDLRCFDTTFDPQNEMVSQESAESGDRFAEASQDRLKRKYVFYFDLLNSPARDIDYLKRKIADFLESSFTENDEGMIFALLPNLKLGVVQKMTSNKEALASSVNQMRGNPTLEARLRNNEKELLDVLYAFGTPTIENAGDSGGGASSRSIETIRLARGFAKTLASQEENTSKFTLNSFLSIADHLAGNHFEGRVVMIYVSGGFSMRPGQIWYDIVEKAIERTSVVGSEDLVFRDHPDNDLYKEVSKTIGLLNRLNVTIYSIDSSGLIGYSRGPERSGPEVTLGANYGVYNDELQDSLISIAQETGGLAITDTQNFQKGLSEISNDMNQQYWLCSNVPSSKKKGEYHKIEVKVSRPGLTVRHRQGYVD